METQNEIQDRILSFLRSEGISSGILADRIGVQRSSISHILSGRNKPSYDFILKFLKKFPEVNAEWFISGNGNMYKEPVQTNLFTTKDNEYKTPEHATEAKPDENKPLVTRENTNKEKKETDHPAGVPVTISERKGRIKKIIILYDTGNFEEFIPA
ncbi:MAG: helix-turn-helix transcriptional regulator [Bacteroidales bacterium]|nr:helix-turn-helix transcriptional regulator [Bacteroidales bacterium]